MKLWKHSRWDALLLGLSLAQLCVMVLLAAGWDAASTVSKLGGFAALGAMIAYNIIVVSHLFAHAPWFTSARLNALVSMLNSVNIGQSVQAYNLTHVRNHHRFNNDRPDENGNTRDLSSTYRDGVHGEHTPLLRYALMSALASMAGRGREMLSVFWFWRLGPWDTNLSSLASRRQPRRGRELRQLQADRAAHCLSLGIFALISWHWTVICYLPAFFLALVMVNVQNYYRHYGANPAEHAADSVSHYGRVYNRLTFNDGYHQEHHLSPSTHWSRMREIHERHRARLEAHTRIVSPVPAMLGFLDRRRPLLHHDQFLEAPHDN